MDDGGPVSFRAMTRTGRFRASVFLGVLWGVTLLNTGAMAQTKEFVLDSKGEWVQTRAAQEGSDEAVMARARECLAGNEAGRAEGLLTAWIESEGSQRSPYYPEAHFLRGDARLARGREEDALRDYEVIVLEYPGSEMFTKALERELEVAIQYLRGMGRRIPLLLGLRLDSGASLAEEIILRANERLPGSRLAEIGLLELADYYYAQRDLKFAVTAYDMFLLNFKRSEFRAKAMQRRVYANIARFKGPAYAATGLVDAKVQIDEFAREFPQDAEKAGLTDAMSARLDESMAAQMLETAAFYLKRDDWVGARFTLRRLIRRYPQTAAASRAIETLRDRGWLEEPAPRQSPEMTPEADVKVMP